MEGKVRLRVEAFSRSSDCEIEIRETRFRRFFICRADLKTRDCVQFGDEALEEFSQVHGMSGQGNTVAVALQLTAVAGVRSRLSDYLPTLPCRLFVFVFVFVFGITSGLAAQVRVMLLQHTDDISDQT